MNDHHVYILRKLNAIKKSIRSADLCNLTSQTEYNKAIDEVNGALAYMDSLDEKKPVFAEPVQRRMDNILSHWAESTLSFHSTSLRPDIQERIDYVVRVLKEAGAKIPLLESLLPSLPPPPITPSEIKDVLQNALRQYVEQCRDDESLRKLDAAVDYVKAMKRS